MENELRARNVPLTESWIAPNGTRASLKRFGRPVRAFTLAKSIAVTPALLRAKLPECAQPILHMEGFRDLTVADRLDVDRHNAEALARVWDPEQLAGRGASDLAAHDHAVAGNQHFLDVELHVGN